MIYWREFKNEKKTNRILLLTEEMFCRLAMNPYTINLRFECLKMRVRVKAQRGLRPTWREETLWRHGVPFIFRRSGWREVALCGCWMWKNLHNGRFSATGYPAMCINMTKVSSSSDSYFWIWKKKQLGSVWGIFVKWVFDGAVIVGRPPSWNFRFSRFHTGLVSHCIPFIRTLMLWYSISFLLKWL